MQGFNRLANMFSDDPSEEDVDERGMPTKFTENRMAEGGGGGLAIIGEALVDKFRAHRWNKQHPGAGLGPEMGPMAQGGPGAPDAVMPGPVVPGSTRPPPLTAEEVDAMAGATSQQPGEELFRMKGLLR